MFGALYGDVIGSYYEVHCTKEYDFLLMAESTFTDDSVLIGSPPSTGSFIHISPMPDSVRCFLPGRGTTLQRQITVMQTERQCVLCLLPGCIKILTR